MTQDEKDKARRAAELERKYRGESKVQSISPSEMDILRAFTEDVPSPWATPVVGPWMKEQPPNALESRGLRTWHNLNAPIGVDDPPVEVDVKLEGGEVADGDWPMLRTPDGVPELDQALGGGIPRGELGVVMPERGHREPKSLFPLFSRLANSDETKERALRWARRLAGDIATNEMSGPELRECLGLTELEAARIVRDIKRAFPDIANSAPEPEDEPA